MMNNRSQIFLESSPESWLIDRHPKYQAVASMLKTFLDDMNFVPLGVNPVNENIENYLKDFMQSHGLECKHLKQTVNLAASLIELAYHKCSLEEKKNLALLNWFAIYIDDSVHRDSQPFLEFTSRLLRRQPQMDPVLVELAGVLDRMWDFYEPMTANAIFNYTLNFVMGCCIEPELEENALKHGDGQSPWYIRNLTGFGGGYALFPFVKRGNFDMVKLIEALPDMNFWVDVSNDLLSFHKEELANETGTYIYNRARNDNKSRYETCAEIVAELKQSRENIYAALADNPVASEMWKICETGLVECHIIQERYHLKDLGIVIQ